MFNPLAKHLGEAVGTGQCVALVQVVCGAPLTHGWKRGALVKGAAVIAGSAIATFDPDGTYGNHTDGRSHAAIYLSQDAQGINVIDQWLTQPAHQRKIVFDDTRLDVNNGTKFYVIESA